MALQVRRAVPLHALARMAQSAVSPVRFELDERRDSHAQALRLLMPPKPDIPIYLATLGPKMLELTGEVADGWLDTSFIPDAADAVLSHLRIGGAIRAVAAFPASSSSPRSSSATSPWFTGESERLPRPV